MNRMYRGVVLGLISLLLLGSVLPVSPAPVRGQDGSPIAADIDADGAPDELDNCVDVGNSDQADSDGDWLGDACDSTPNGDSDGDGVDEWSDRCPGFDDWVDSNGNGVPDGCDAPPTHIPLPATETPSAMAIDTPAPTTAPSEPVSVAEEDLTDGNTPAGEWVWVDLDGGFRILFESVLQGGATTATSLTMDGLPELPDGNLQGPGSVVSITSTASWAGPAYVCGPFDRSLVRYMYDSLIYRLDGDSWVIVGHGLDENLYLVCGQSDSLGTFTVGRPPFDPGNTLVGANVEPSLDSPFRVRFDSVTSSGQTTAADLDPSWLPPLPAAFDPSSMSVSDIGTTAIWEGAVYACGPYDGQFEGQLSIYSIFLLQNGAWVEIGNGLDEDYGAICGYADSLGIFATARSYVTGETPQPTILPTNTAAPSTNTAMPVEPLQLTIDGGNGTVPVATGREFTVDVTGGVESELVVDGWLNQPCDGAPHWTMDRAIDASLVAPNAGGVSWYFQARDTTVSGRMSNCVAAEFRTPEPFQVTIDGELGVTKLPIGQPFHVGAAGWPSLPAKAASWFGADCIGPASGYSVLNPTFPHSAVNDPGAVLSFMIQGYGSDTRRSACLTVTFFDPNATVTSTATLEPTGTATPTGTFTETPTAEPSSTPTTIPSVTATNTSAPTETATGTASSTPSATATATLTDTETATPSATASRTPTALPVMFAIGTQLMTTQEVRVRNEPRNSGYSVHRLSAGADVTVSGTPVFDGPIVWYPVTFANGGGWIDARYLGPARTPTPTVTATATRPSPYNYPVGTILFASQDTRLLQSPNGSRSKTPDVPRGAEVTVTGAPVVKNGREWLPVLVLFGSGSGWVDVTHVGLGPLPTLTGTPPTVTRTPTRASGQYLVVGDRVLITSVANLRDTPSRTGLIVTIVPQGATGYVTGQPVREGKEFFYPVVLDGLPGGYLPQSALRRIAANSTITPTRTPTVTRTPVRSATPTRTPTRHPGNVFSPGSAVVVIGRTPAKLLSSPSSAAPVLGVVIAGQAGVVVGYPVREGSAYYYPVQIDGYPLGYLASGVMQRADGNVSRQLTQTPIRSATATSTPIANQWIASAVHLRNGPSTSYSILAVLPKGTAIIVTGERIVDGSTVWFRVRTAAGTIGWVPGAYLTAIVPQ